ncbi:MAG TPA: DUF4129 domain-containing protein [Roseiflexaceae bacterium]|nr:DUF4129 domain-containing protein [Roseiflexaceae bacterium]HMP39300.1 DUF4129 domain-containing protein [Roseiflexaceae bacterium]
MSHRIRISLLALLAVTIGVLGVLAAGLPGIRFEPGRPLLYQLLFAGSPSGTPAVPGSGGMSILLVLFWSSLAIVALGAIFSASFRSWLIRTLPSYLLFIVGLILVLSAINPQLTGGGVAQEFSPPAEVEEVPLGDPLGPPPDLVRQPPAWIAPLLTLLLALGVTALIWRAGRHVIARRMPPEEDLAVQLAAGAAGAAAEIAAGADLRDTVTRCYRDMEQLVQHERGIGRDRAMTPREFEERLVRAGFDDRHIRRLTRLFERVRYSPRPPDERDEREALACLRAIAEYGVRS